MAIPDKYPWRWVKKVRRSADPRIFIIEEAEGMSWGSLIIFLRQEGWNAYRGRVATFIKTSTDSGQAFLNGCCID